MPSWSSLLQGRGGGREGRDGGNELSASGGKRGGTGKGSSCQVHLQFINNRNHPPAMGLGRAG